MSDDALDIEDGLMDWLVAEFPELDGPAEQDHVGTATLGIYAAQSLPYVRVVRTDSGGFSPFLDYPVIEIDLFASRRGDAVALGARIHRAMMKANPETGAPFRAGDFLIRTASGKPPIRLPWENTAVIRYGTEYTLSTKYEG